MVRVFRSKLIMPDVTDMLQRPRLLGAGRPRVLVAQAPAGAGKSIFLAQWAAAQGHPVLYYTLDEQDRDPAAFAGHVEAGFMALWPGWAPTAPGDVGALAADLVDEAVVRPPLVLVLDRLESAFGFSWLADCLALLIRYAPPGLTLALGTRAPLPADLPLAGRSTRIVTASELAMTAEEVRAWLGERCDWQEALETTGGYPLALELCAADPAGWQEGLAAHLLTTLPAHVPTEVARALVGAWTTGALSLESFALQIAQGQPGNEQLWRDGQELRRRLFLGEFAAVLQGLDLAWKDARASGDKELMASLALLRGEAHYVLGEYGAAVHWYRRAFELVPLLETVGTHSLVAIQRDLANLEEAEALGRRCVAALRSRGDLQALAYACAQLGSVYTEMGRFDEADALLQEGERLGLRLAGEPFYGILAMGQRSAMLARRADATARRTLAESAYQRAKSCSPWLEAICGYILAAALFQWGEIERALALMEQSEAFLTRIDSKWQLHMIHAIKARVFAARGQAEQAGASLDRSLTLAAREGYLQYLSSSVGPGPELIAAALVRGTEAAHCQEVLVRMGDGALPALLELVRSSEPRARRAAIYPLVRIGGEAATGAIHHLLYDADESVRGSALAAFQSLKGAPQGTPASHAPQETPPPPEAAKQAPALRISLLGPFRVEAGGQPVSAWRTVKVRDLLAYLVLAGDRPVSRDQIIEALWSDSDPEAGQSLLHTTLYYLRRALKPAGEELITFAGGAYRLERAGLELDLDRFLAWSAAGGEANWRAAAERYGGDLLEGLDYPWCEAARTRARTIYVGVLRSLAAQLRREGRPGEAIDWLQRQLAVEPLAEDAHLALVECFAATGNRNAALQQYRTLQHLLDEELGLEPGAEAQAAYRRLLG